jgi:hypothetical protein
MTEIIDRWNVLPVVLWPIRCVAVGILLTVLLMAAVYVTDLLPADAMRDNLVRSFENGSLQHEDWLEGNRTIGFNQYNDCLLVMMIRFRPPSALRSTVAPVVAFNDYPTELSDSDATRITECRIARDAVYSDDPTALYEAERYYPYSRYVHAFRIPFNLLVSVTPVSTIRAIYRWSAVGLLGVLLAVAVVRGLRARRSGELDRAAAFLGFATIAGAFLAFYGLDLFGTSLTHGPADLLLYAALAWLALGAREPTPGAWDVTAAVLGALAFGFEFLHGTLPLMVAIILGAAALRNLASGSRCGVAGAARLVGAFALGTAGALAAKLLAIYGLEGADGVRGFLGQLHYRMDGEDFSLRDVVRFLNWAIFQIGWGSRGLALAALAAGMAGALLAAGLLAFGQVRREDRTVVLTALASIAVIFAWYPLFRNHSAIHAAFMVRLLVWPIGMGLACVWIVWAGRSAGRPKQEGAPETGAVGPRVERRSTS